ncbi:MAG: hypothetical protein PW734_05885 [Verrucomicrobium sp.]|nr:hypothetical protein [Verrucomicrobium sp.]
MRRLLPLFCLLLLAARAGAADPFADPQILEVQQLHDAAVREEKGAVPKLLTRLETLTQEHPQNALLHAYLGSAYTLKSRDAFPGPGKLAALKKGLQTMDAAVAGAPRDVGARLVRAINNFELPAFFRRRQTARDDFTYLVQEIREPGIGDDLDLATRQTIYYYAGLSFAQEKDRPGARQAWRDGLQLDASTPLGQKMGKALAKLD